MKNIHLKSFFNLKTLLLICVFASLLILDFISSTAAKFFLPDYTGKVEKHNSTLQNNLFYIKNDDEIIFYPWNKINAQEIYDVDAEQEIDLQNDYFNIIQNMLYDTSSKVLPVNDFCFDLKFQTVSDYSFYFIKDLKYMSSFNKNEVVLNIAFKNGEAAYFHCSLLPQTEPTEDMIKKANNRITEDFAEIKKYYETSHFYYLNENIFSQVFTLIVNNTNYDKVDAIHYLLKSNFSSIVYKNEILVMFTFDRHTLVLFYDINNEFFAVIATNIKPILTTFLHFFDYFIYAFRLR